MAEPQSEYGARHRDECAGSLERFAEGRDSGDHAMSDRKEAVSGGSNSPHRGGDYPISHKAEGVTLERPLTHTLIGRACGPDADDSCVQAKVSYHAEPTEIDLAWVEDGLRKTYRNAFGEDAARVGLAVLPYVEEYDGDDERDELPAFCPDCDMEYGSNADCEECLEYRRG